jgi:hypothetical protein
VAYHSGKAANRQAPATMSHVSLRSQTGPIVLMICRRPMSSFARKGSDIPTPKSKPSSTK